MHEGFLDIDYEREQRFFPIDCMALVDDGIPDDTSFARNTQSVAMSRHDEQERQRDASDLVILDADPLDSVENLDRVVAVVVRGNYLAVEQLDAIQE